MFEVFMTSLIIIIIIIINNTISLVVVSCKNDICEFPITILIYVLIENLVHAHNFFNNIYHLLFLTFLAFNFIIQKCFQVQGGSTKFLNFVIYRNYLTYRWEIEICSFRYDGDYDDQLTLNFLTSNGMKYKCGL